MITNIAAYKFVPLAHLKRWRKSLLATCRRQQLKGSILLSPEGINLFVAGSHQAVNEFLGELCARDELSDLDVKYSYSEQVPFTRMLIKIKREIIAFGVDVIQPAKQTSAKLSPAELKQWLDEGREIELLDVRNAYEVELGTFQRAHSLGLASFRDFPNAIRGLPADARDKPLVMFCTGGIRCEKAGPYLEQQGFRQVYQLDGGILKYFEQCGGAHYQGDCFVFDHRVAVDPQLAETDAVLCFACQAPVSVPQQESARYVPGQSCPHCYVDPSESYAATMRRRNERLRELAHPLPGSVPYTNRRPIHIPAAAHGHRLIDHLVRTYAFVEPTAWEARFHSGLVRLNDQPIGKDQRVRAGECYEHLFPDTREPAVSADIRVIHEDASLVVVNKPAPLPMHPCGRFNRNTLSYLLGQVYRPQQLRLAHRLDANTTGVVLFSRTREVAARVQPQFSAGRVIKKYICRVHGWPAETDFVCQAAISARSLPAGGRTVDPRGLQATTEFRRLSPLGDGTTLVEARPITGRTNQIRIHLWHLGYPIVGDPMYLPEGRLAAQQTLGLGERPLCLHARALRLDHPAHGLSVEFVADLPGWAAVPSVPSESLA